jgi:hypothetical protein
MTTARERIVEIASRGASSQVHAELCADQVLAQHMREIAALLTLRYGVRNRAASWLLELAEAPEEKGKEKK